MKKIRRGSALWIILGVILIILGITVYVTSTPWSGDLINTETGTLHTTSPFHSAVNTILIVSIILLIIVFVYECVAYWISDEDLRSCLERFTYLPEDEDDYKKEAKDVGVSSIFKIKWWKVILSLFIIVVVVCSVKIGKKTASLYNSSKQYHYSYNTVTTSRKTFYDNMWKTYTLKDGIAKLNKETFIEVTKLIIENRADGKNLTWKWLQENQNIPYSEFTKFYEDLSTFVESKRSEYYLLELQCQNIAQANNVLLDTFPNNVFNKIVKCEKINYEYGFLSDSTNSVFNSKSENLK